VSVNDATELIRAIGSLWLLALVVVLVWFRKPIGETLAALVHGVRLRRAKVPGVGEFEFDTFGELAKMTQTSLADSVVVASGNVAASERYVQGGATVVPAPPPDPQSLTARFGGLATTAPADAILMAYEEIATVLRRKLADAGVADAFSLGPDSLTLYAGAADNVDVMPVNVVSAFMGITSLRNYAAQGGRNSVTPDQAREYLRLADEVMLALSQPPTQKP
jgi:hypothetical protein